MVTSLVTGNPSLTWSDESHRRGSQDDAFCRMQWLAIVPLLLYVKVVGSNPLFASTWATERLRNSAPAAASDPKRTSMLWAYTIPFEAVGGAGVRVNPSNLVKRSNKSVGISAEVNSATIR